MLSKDVQFWLAQKITKELARKWYPNFKSDEILSEAYLIVEANKDNKSTYKQLVLATISKLKRMYQNELTSGMTFRGQHQITNKEEVKQVPLEIVEPKPKRTDVSDLLDFIHTALTGSHPLREQIIIDSFIGGYTLKEIAAKYGISFGRVGEIRKQSLKCIKKKAEESGFNIGTFMK